MTLKYNEHGHPYEDLTEENKKLKKEIEELKADLARAEEEHQYDNLVHQKELESLRKNK